MPSKCLSSSHSYDIDKGWSVHVSDNGPVSSLMCVFIVRVALWKMTTCLPGIKFNMVKKSKSLRRDEGEMETEALSHIVCVIWLPLTLFFFLNPHPQKCCYHSVYMLSLKCNYISVICMLLVQADDEEQMWKEMHAMSIDFLLERTRWWSWGNVIT